MASAKKADRALASQQIDPRDYAAVFIGDGTGSLLDVAGNARLVSITASIHERGGVVGACGATSGLAGDGTPRYRSGLCFD
jgi:putative intracellular protease/amidase